MGRRQLFLRIAATAAALSLPALWMAQAPAAQASEQAKDFNVCGELPVADVPGPGSYKLIIKVKKISCKGGQKVARKYFKQVGSIVPELGSVEHVKHFRCKQKNYYSPFEPSFECRNQGQSKVVKGLFPPENVKTRTQESEYRFGCALDPQRARSQRLWRCLERGLADRLTTDGRNRLPRDVPRRDRRRSPIPH